MPVISDKVSIYAKKIRTGGDRKIFPIVFGYAYFVFFFGFFLSNP